MKRLLVRIFGRPQPSPEPPEPGRSGQDHDGVGGDGVGGDGAGADADERVAEITRLFESRDWQLQLRAVEHGDDRRWEATFFPASVGAKSSAVVYAPTRLDAAESAWWRYKREPWLRST
jgi:hypothetical protein